MYEYTIIIVPLNTREMRETLNSYGKYGWKAHTIQDVTNDNLIRIIFERYVKGTNGNRTQPTKAASK